MTAVAEATDNRTHHRTWMGGDRYQEASELAFYAEYDRTPTRFAMNLAGRPNQYDLWPGFYDLAKPGDNLVLALDESDDTPTPIRLLAAHFASATRADRVTLRRGSGEIGVRRIWVLQNWDGARPSLTRP